MSQRVVGYEGEGRQRRPVYADEGHAAAAVGDPVAALGVLSVAGFRGDVVEVPTGGAGPVERRPATPEELAAARERDAKPQHLVASGGGLARPSPLTGRPTDVAMTQASRQRGAAANRARIAAAKTAPAQEEPAVAEAAQDVTTEAPEDEPPRVGLAALADAVVEAMEAEGELEQAEAIADQVRIRWEQARAALHAAYRALDEPAPATRPEAEPVATVRVWGLATGGNDVALVPAPPAIGDRPPTPPRPPRDREAPAPSTGGGPGRLGTQSQRILDATIRHHGDRAAAAVEVGTSTNNLTTVLHNIGRKGLLPIELIAQLPAGFAKYTGV